MEHFIPDIYAGAVPPDIVVATEEGTYVGKYDRGRFDPETPAEEQPIWSIILYDTSQEGTTKTLYPGGSKRAVFVWDEREEYNYKYALSL